jgi:EpsI family protein
VRARALTVAVLVLSASLLTTALTRATDAAGGPGATDARRLDALPMTVQDWSGYRLPDIDEQSKRVLGADDYVNRRYARGDGAVDLFVAYYGAQRQGDSIHSPRNCLPGAGWRPVASSTIELPLNGRSATVNRYVIEKGLDRRVVFYWYQGRGRVVANEYANKLWLMVDAMTTGRSDGALVRAMAPATHEGERDAKAFVQAVFAPISQVLP